MSARPRRAPWRTLLAVAAVALGLLAAGTGGTRSGWATGQLDATASAATGSLAFSHAYQSTTCSFTARTNGALACAGSIAPTTGATAGGVSATDAITDNGVTSSAGLQSEVSASSCGPVSFANRKATSNPMLARYGTTFHTSGGPMDSAGYVALDGASPGGYATSVVPATQPGSGLVSAGLLSGVGVWFKASAGTSGPLFSFGASPSNGTGNDDRALYLDSGGKLNLIWNLAGSKVGATTTGYADNTWHFAYVTFGGVNVVLVGLIPQVTLYVDGAQQATTPLVSLAAMSSYQGYWHLAWAPTAVTGLGSAYFGGSLSNFVVVNGGSIPDGSTLGKPATQAAFNTATSAATDHWVLDDTGTSTFGGTLPSTMTAPCAQVKLDWTFTNPTGTAASATPLSTFADGTWHAVAAPGPGTTQTSTVTLRQGTGYSTDVAGLHLYAPLSHRVQTTPTGSTWSRTLTWSGAEAAFIS